MFKLFSGISLKTWLIIAVVLTGLGFVAKYNYRAEQVTELKAETKTQAVTIAAQKDAMVLDAKLDKVNEKAQVAVQQAVKQTTVKHETIQARAEQTTRAIEARYDAEPVTVTTVDQEQAELSTVRIDSLWQAYCTASPNATDCQPLP